MGAASNHDLLYCRAHTLIGMDGFLESRGVSPTRLLKQHGINPALFSQADAFLSWDSVCSFFESAALKPSLTHLGLLWSAALTQDHRQIGPILHLAGLSNNGREYLRLAARYQLIHKNGLIHTLHEDRDHEWMAWRTTPHRHSAPCRQMVEYSISNSYRMVKQFLSDTAIDEIHFTHAAPNNTDIYDTMFSCPVIFGAKHNQLMTRHKYLDRELKIDRPSLRRALTQYLDKHRQAFSEGPHSLSQTISGDLPALFGVNRSDMRSIASVYGMSEKKLQRLLRDENTNFSTLRDEARCALAKRLLSLTHIPIARLAVFLDYASPHTFHHACTRWFGMSPRDLRKEAKGET